jgi:maleylacetoacetate isomerase
VNEELTLFHYWRSTSSWRVRWALLLKRVDAHLVHVGLLNGESESPEHLKRNPMGFVPVLQVGHRYLQESVAILEWLQELIPAPSFFPGDSYQKAHIRALVEIINAGTQPLQNLSVLDQYSEDEKKRKEWMQHFIRRGLKAFEILAKDSAGQFCVGDQITAADLFLIPQLYAAGRNEISLDEFPLLKRINVAALATKEASASAPEKYRPTS